MKASAGKRVLVLIPGSLYPQNSHMRQEAVALLGEGYEVSIICPRAAKKEKQPWQEIIEGVHVYRFPAPPRRFDFLGYAGAYSYGLVVVFLLSLYVLFRRGFDIVHLYNPPDIIVLIVAFYKLLGKRFVYDHRDLAPEMYHAIFQRDNRLIHATLIRLEKLCCRLADLVIAPNESYKKIEMERGGVPAHRISVVRSGTNLKVIRLVDPDPEIRQHAPHILCYVGAMGLHDGVDYLLRALRHLRSDLGRTDFFCLMVGGGKLQPQMKLMSEQLGLTGCVWFTGPVKHAEVARYLSTADICLAPEPSNSYNDRSTVIKVNEYMAVGKPVVSFDLPEHRFTAQEAGVYAQPNEEMDFAHKIAWLMDNPERRAEMGLFGRQRVEAFLSWDHQVKNLLAGYRQVVTGNRRQGKQG